METVGKLIARVMREASCEENRRTILGFLNFLEGEGYSEHYQSGFAKTLLLLDKHLGKPFREAKEAELMAFLAKYRGQPHTRATYATRIKAFYRWLLTGKWKKGPYPKVVENISTTVKKYELPVKSPNDILTQDEILAMIDAAENPRDKALIALLYDSGARPSEILNLKLKDIKLNKTHGEIFVNGKTGMRRIPIVFSVPYLIKWLNAHPAKNDPEAKLFPKLKHGRGGENFTSDGLDGLVKRLARKAGIRKRVTPYLFRHSRLTELANILRDSQLKALAGWTAGSRMAEYYIRLAGLDLDSPILDYYGIKREEKLEAKLKPRICPRCEHVNTPNAIYCEKCGFALDEKIIVEKLSHEELDVKKIEKLEDEVKELREALTHLALILQKHAPPTRNNALYGVKLEDGEARIGDVKLKLPKSAAEKVKLKRRFRRKLIESLSKEGVYAYAEQPNSNTSHSSNIGIEDGISDVG